MNNIECIAGKYLISRSQLRKKRGFSDYEIARFLPDPIPLQIDRDGKMMDYWPAPFVEMAIASPELQEWRNREIDIFAPDLSKDDRLHLQRQWRRKAKFFPPKDPAAIASLKDQPLGEAAEFLFSQHTNFSELSEEIGDAKRESFPRFLLDKVARDVLKKNISQWMRRSL
ncbi:hypothetical protein [Synechococcus sp. BDU 130192]|uniref:hypothetical protein n=1 Tax=Synechococcus sp. BDU 130192 TaxID=2042059 RepID=UPI00117CFFA0|nr:hypothetical protein [Synechococcus sp. BDU 130192]